MSEHIISDEALADIRATCYEAGKSGSERFTVRGPDGPEIVRCRDCAILNEDTGECYAFTFGSLKFIPRPDHFCANGVRES